MQFVKEALSWILGAITLSVPVVLVSRRFSRKRVIKGAHVTQFQKGGKGSMNFQVGNDIRIEGKDLHE